VKVWVDGRWSEAKAPLYTLERCRRSGQLPSTVCTALTGCATLGPPIPHSTTLPKVTPGRTRVLYQRSEEEEGGAPSESVAKGTNFFFSQPVLPPRFLITAPTKPLLAHLTALLLSTPLTYLRASPSSLPSVSSTNHTTSAASHCDTRVFEKYGDLRKSHDPQERLFPGGGSN
jgi:hypothetical protein